MYWLTISAIAFELPVIMTFVSVVGNSAPTESAGSRVAPEAAVKGEKQQGDSEGFHCHQATASA
ncbi:hypothetical protein HVA01_18340 [Halovibrio variabilis]|uniref:Uncharacterized protein n=1 Tax=Halovibrio variabilis TaxID=31910 RepID=A0A511UR74_9GAMM|nr:hypothetical protein HVA01_18340 [Halovibrio variabilis]